MECRSSISPSLGRRQMLAGPLRCWPPHPSVSYAPTGLTDYRRDLRDMPRGTPLFYGIHRA